MSQTFWSSLPSRLAANCADIFGSVVAWETQTANTQLGIRSGRTTAVQEGGGGASVSGGGVVNRKPKTNRGAGSSQRVPSANRRKGWAPLEQSGPERDTVGSGQKMEGVALMPGVECKMPMPGGGSRQARQQPLQHGTHHLFVPTGASWVSSGAVSGLLHTIDSTLHPGLFLGLRSPTIPGHGAHTPRSVLPLATSHGQRLKSLDGDSQNRAASENPLVTWERMGNPATSARAGLPRCLTLLTASLVRAVSTSIPSAI